uniref:Uncharacterized protein n=1 Tax=Tetradesmus obliquus TaxID=3088 RepID=A0A383WKV4_TETOB|eukprot:jgi/Sobl393_1/16420/SZX67802.1
MCLGMQLNGSPGMAPCNMRSDSTFGNGERFHNSTAAVAAAAAAVPVGDAAAAAAAAPVADAFVATASVTAAAEGAAAAESG